MDKLRAVFSRVASSVPKGAPQVPQGGGSAVVGLVTLGGLGYLGLQSMITLQPGQAGLVYNRIGGLNEQKVLTEGINFVIPWLQRAIIYDIRTRPQPIDTQSGSKDLQMVQISLRVLYRPDPENLPFIYRRLGTDFDARVLPSIVNEVTKAVIAQYNASELLTKRNQVSSQIQSMLQRRAREFSIILEDVGITHLQFSKEYTAAVEAKQVAQQDAERAKYIVDRAIQEKKSIVIRAQGEAQAASLIGNAIQKNPAFLQLRRIEASKDIAQTIVQSNNKVYLDADTLMINTLGENSAGSTSASAKK